MPDINDKLVKTLPLPARGARIAYDTRVKGFGIRVTSAGARSFVLNYYTKAGRERRYTIGSFPDWKTAAARSEAADLKRRIDGGADPVGEANQQRQAPTVADLADRFEAEYLPRKRPKTQQEYRRLLATAIRPALGKRKVVDVGFGDIDAVHRAITARGRKHLANRAVAVASRLFTMAIKWRMRADNPCRGVERNPEPERRRYLSTEELARLAKALPTLRDEQGANVIRLLLLTGARRGEVLRARWRDLDLAAGKWVKPGATTKQKITHEVPLSAAAVQLFERVRRLVPQDVPWVFPSGGSHRQDVKKTWAAACDAARIDGARLHDLRHTYASVLASAGLSLPVIGALLGHTQPSTTQRYAHLFDDPLRAATERASAIITGAASAKIEPLRGRRRG